MTQTHDEIDDLDMRISEQVNRINDLRQRMEDADDALDELISAKRRRDFDALPPKEQERIRADGEKLRSMILTAGYDMAIKRALQSEPAYRQFAKIYSGVLD